MFEELAGKIFEGIPVGRDEAVRLIQMQGPRVYDLLALGGRIARHYGGNQVELCSIVNARSGRCSEDCAFCAQSARYRTGAVEYPLLEPEEILRRALRVQEAGVRRFSIVTSGRGISGRDLDGVLEAIRLLRRETDLSLCASLGIIGEREARMLREAGLTTYHHNLETAPGYFQKICSTHTYRERVETIVAARRAGLRVCAGGIIGLGESPAQRVELALELRRLSVDSVPLNILNPIPGTPLAGRERLPVLEVLKTIAVFRLLLPGAVLRLCGGRREGLRGAQALALMVGANGLMVGDYLTTRGELLERDLQMLVDLGLEVA